MGAKMKFKIKFLETSWPDVEWVVFSVFNFEYDSTGKSRKVGFVLLGFEFSILTTGEKCKA